MIGTAEHGLASDDAQWVTGQRLMVSGGTKLGRFHDAAARLKGLDAKHSLVPEERSLAVRT